MCGEEGGRLAKPIVHLGSPPHVRGRGQFCTITREPRGITPARAGKRAGSSPVRSYVWDHPRACGEEATSAPGCVVITGSPPRVRGRALILEEAEAVPGITPARAGKRLSSVRIHAGRKDHPRACGEERTPGRSHYRTGGSPPRVRGREDFYAVYGLGGRITPARAGKSAGRGHAGFYPQDHPRACGEEPAATITTMTTTGSPPRVRGRD